MSGGADRGLGDRPEEGQTVLVGALPTTFRILGDMVGGAYSVVEQVVEPGILVWPHLHTKHDQVAVVLSGDLGVRVGDREWTAYAGAIIYRPRLKPHTVWNATDVPATFLEISSPSSFETYFYQMSRLLPEDAARREAILDEFGVTGVPEWIDDLGGRYGVKL